jgi:hypothetical protein
MAAPRGVCNKDSERDRASLQQVQIIIAAATSNEGLRGTAEGRKKLGFEGGRRQKDLGGRPRNE